MVATIKDTSPVKTITGKFKALTHHPENAPRWRWYHGVAFYGIAQVLAFGLTGLVSVARGNAGKSARELFIGDTSYFKNLKQPKITPPSWAFGPAWTINNILTIYGNLRALNMPANTPGRGTFLRLQAASWLNYVVFNAAYFGLRSPLNAMVLTLSMFGLTIASLFVALFRMRDTKVALSLATLFVWLIVASLAGTSQALWNPDDFYHTEALLEPDPALVKAHNQ